MIQFEIIVACHSDVLKLGSEHASLGCLMCCGDEGSGAMHAHCSTFCVGVVCSGDIYMRVSLTTLNK